MKNLDKELLLWLNNSGSESIDFFWVFLTDKFIAIPFFGILILLIWYKSNFKTAFVVGFFLLALVGFTDLFATLIKNWVERPRPCSVNSILTDQVRVVSDGIFKKVTTSNTEKCEKFSFFSSHAAVSFALAVFLGRLLQKLRKAALLWMLLWAFLVSVSRIYLGFHYPSDIFVGGVVGMVFGFIAFEIYQLIIKNYLSKFAFKPNK